jgi:gamma-glutamyltranspeptidase/glutathione hydrolase
MIEAKKLAFEDRARFYADPDFARVPVEWLVSKEYARERRALIREGEAARRCEPGKPPGGADTVYLTVADAARNMVSLIQSNYRGMGSGMTPYGLGFVLQDRGEMFSLDPRHPNCYAPHKRPFHTIIPAFVTEGGRPWMSFGVMGGPMQPQGHAQIVCNMRDFAMGVQEAGDAPRWIHEGSPEPTGSRMTGGGEVFLESGYGEAVARQLAAWGHQVSFEAGRYGGYQAIRHDAANDVYLAASESRFDGQAAGY